jgi:putative ABC transport system ATP-binding protein
VVRLDRVSKEYRRGEAAVMALRDVSLHVTEGEFCALMGPSGCGKSTLLNIVAGLDHPTAGRLFLEGRSTHDLSDGEWTSLRRSLIGMVFQSFHLLPTLTAEDNVALPLLLQGENGSSVRRRAAESLARVGMEPRARHRPGELSGGEQQRVAIARAIAKRSEVLLCDEPTGALDFETGVRVLEVLEAANRELGTTTAVITHNAAIAGMADRVIRMRSGRIVETCVNERRLPPAELVW